MNVKMIGMKTPIKWTIWSPSRRFQVRGESPFDTRSSNDSARGVPLGTSKTPAAPAYAFLGVEKSATGEKKWRPQTRGSSGDQIFELKSL